MIKIDEQGRKIGEADIVFLEDKFGMRLPDEYRQFLLTNNGGIPSPDTVDVVGAPGSPTDVQVFFGVDRGVESSDLLWNLRMIGDRFPDHRVFPIACDSGGSLFCFQAGDRCGPDVMYLDFDDPAGTLYEVAPNFNEFLKKIRLWR